MSGIRESLREQTAGGDSDGLMNLSSASVTCQADPVNREQPTSVCPLCNETHDEGLALLAQDKAIHRILSDDLLAEEEYLARDLAAQIVDGPGDVDLRAYRFHRLEVIREELARRRRLERYGAPGVPNKGTIPQELLERLKQAAPVEEIALSLGLVTHGSRPRIKMRCPLPSHEDEHPSATIYCDEGRWWCFVCNQGGDVIDLVQAAQGLSWREAVKWLADGLGIELPSRHSTKGTPDKPAILSGSLGR